MKKKLCSILLALTMVLTLLPVSALAEGDEAPAGGEPTPTEAPAASNVAKIGDKEYATLAKAVEAAESGATITLLSDVTASTTIPAGKTITLDLNSKTLKAQTQVFDVYGNLTIKNGTVEMNSTENNVAIWLNGTAKLTIESNATVSVLNQGFAIAMWSNCTAAELTVKGTLKGGNGLTVNGTIANPGNKVTVDGATIESDGHGIYQAGVSDIVVKNANITGSTAIEVRAGSMTIESGTFTATAAEYSCNPNGSGTTTEGAALAIAQHTTKKDISVTINGGTFKGIKALNESNPQNNDPAPQVTLNVANGTFNGDVSITDNKNTSITGGTFTDLSALDYLAEGANVTVKLVADTQKDVVIPANTTVTLDLAGHKLTNVSGHTITNDGTLTVTGNGTVDNVTHCKGALYNKSGATAILNGGTFTRSQEAGTYEPYGGNGNSWYTIQNDGTMTINAGTTVTTRLNDSGKAVGGYSSLIRNGGNAGTAPTLLINGGHFNGGINTVKNDAGGTLTIKGGDFSNTTQYVIMNWNIADIYDGTFEANSTASAVLFSASWDGSAGTLNFHGGNVKTTSESQKAIRDYFDASHTGKVAVSGGTFTSDPSAYVAPGYVVSYNGSTYTVYYPVPVIPNNNNNSSSTTTKNPDGSTTTTTTDKATGAVTETTTTANGSVGTVKTDANGSTEISASISAADVKATEQKNAPVIAPITVAPAASSAAAPVIKLSVPANAGEVAVAIPVVNAKQGTVAIKVNPDGTEEIIKTAVITENGLVLGVKGSMQIKVINNSKNFADTVGHWAASDVDFVSARELFNGTAPALFSPEASMTRGMVVTVIARLAGENTDGGANWYDKGCAWAVANGVSDGTDPNGSITREQLAAMLYRYCGSPAASGSLSAYADAASVSAFGSDAMQWCVNNGIINGMDGLLNPQGQATRAQVSAMFARYIRLAAAK